jgi:hypothetical protein
MKIHHVKTFFHGIFMSEFVENADEKGSPFGTIMATIAGIAPFK